MPEVQSNNPQQSAQNTALFLECVTTYSHQAMIAMGKIVNPFTKKAERNLEAARFFIDMVEMLEAKTKGNLSKDEERFLATTLSSLRLTFVEEMDRPEPKPESAEPKPAEPPPQAESAPEPAVADETKKRFTKKYD
jgi:hypothetical protein